MGNIVMKEDGFTPIINSSEMVPHCVVQIAQYYVNKLAIQPDVQRSKWNRVDVKENEEKKGTYVLYCGFDTLLPHHCERYNGTLNIGPKVYVDFTQQMSKVRKWLSITKQEDVSMEVGQICGLKVMINLPSIEDILRAKDDEITRLTEMLYWSPQGEGFRQTQSHFYESVQGVGINQ